MEEPDERDLMANPFILSDSLSMGPLSFIDSRQKANKHTPPPKYFEVDYIKEKFALPTEIQEILFGYEFPENGGMVCTNKEMLDR